MLRTVRLLLFLLVSWNVFAADVYFDLSCTFDGNGASGACAASGGAAGARNNLGHTAVDNDTWLFKRGNTYVRSGQIDLGAAANVTWDDYGDTSLAKPIIRMSVTTFGAINVAAASGNVTFNDLTIDSCVTTSSNGVAGCIVASKIGGTGRAANLEFNRVDFSNTTTNAITLNGTDTSTAAATFTIRDSSFTNIGSDAVFGAALVYVWDNTDCSYVSVNSVNGDCIGFINGDPTSVSITNSRLDRTNNDYKQAIIVDTSTGSGNVTIEGNEIYCYGGTTTAATSQNCILLDSPTVIRRIYMECAGFCIGFGGVSGNELSSSIIRVKNLDDTSPPINLGGNNGVVYNTIVAGEQGAPLSGRGMLTMQATYSGWAIKNSGCVNVPICIKSDSVGNNPSVSYGVFHNVTSPRLDSASAAFSSGGGDVTSEPNFTGGTYPTSANGFRLSSGSPLIGSGTFIGRNKDYFGNIADQPVTDIGAHQYSVDTRTTIETRN